MKGSTALKKINTRTKQLHKEHPGKKYSTLRKQASAEYRAGKLKAHKPRKKRAKVSGKRKYKVTHRVKKIGSHKRARKRSAKKRVTTAVRTRTRTRTVTRYRRVGGMGSTTTTALLVGGGLLVAYLMLKPKGTVTVNPPQLIPTGNPTRDNSAATILAYAQAAGLAASAIASLINSLNNSDDATVVQAAQQPNLGINTLLAVPTGGPSITL